MAIISRVNRKINELFQLNNFSWTSVIMGVLLLLTITIPSLFMAFGASSMAAGLLVVIVFYLALCLKFYSMMDIKNNAASILFTFTSIVFGIFIHGLVSFWLHDSFNLYRFLQTFIYLMFLGLGAFSFVLLAKKLEVSQVDFILKFVFYSLLTVGILGILGYSPFFNGTTNVFFYIEPSHFALSFLPFLLYVVVQSDFKYKFICLALSFEVALLLPNLTLMIGVIFIAVVMLTLRNLLVVLSSFPLLFYFNKAAFYFHSIITSSTAKAAAPDALSYVADRVAFTSYNMSILVFKSGWERAYLNFIDYFGFGVGFQQLGFIGNQGENMINIIARAGGGRKLCLFDGSTVAAKFVGEFGIFAIAALGLYLIYAIKYTIKLRGFSLMQDKARDCRNVFYFAVFIMFSFDFFIRGTGYFSDAGFLFITSLIWIIMQTKSAGIKP